MNFLDGQLLIADPRLADMNFFRSVVLITRHNGDGAMGLVLNQPSKVSLSDIWDKISEVPLARDDLVYVGGPVQGPLAALHDSVECSELEVMPELHFSVNRDQIDRLLSSVEGNCRVYSGYSGWGPGQLEGELEVGGWLVMPARNELVFADSELIYKTVCEEVGSGILFSDNSRGIFPSDPSLN